MNRCKKILSSFRIVPLFVYTIYSYLKFMNKFVKDRFAIKSCNTRPFFLMRNFLYGHDLEKIKKVLKNLLIDILMKLFLNSKIIIF